MKSSPPYLPRLHLIFVPGFGGFDALGEIEYYPGTSKVAEDWRSRGDSHKRGRTVLHYFDNLPTAGVRTRAERLKRFLTLRRLWNDFQAGDKLALIGHSTGGLDIRELLQELERVSARADCPDDWEPEAWLLEQANARQLRQMIRRVVFLSVPQRGTNIADWLRSIRLLRVAAISWLRNAVDVADDSALVKPQHTFAQLFHHTRRGMPSWLNETIDRGVPDLLAAVLDVLGEVAERGSRDPVKAARARESLSHLNLWLGQTDGDFLAIDDLCCAPPGGGLVGRVLWRAATFVSATARSQQGDLTSLARLDRAQRDREIASWQANGIEVLSIATRGKSPDPELRDSKKIRSYTGLLKLLGFPGATQTDGPYRLVFHACASGPFLTVRSSIEEGEPDHRASAICFDAQGEGQREPAEKIASWHNDGVVNTASMLWPSGPHTLLVEADHADIIGHYEKKRPSRKTAPRKYKTYDIFRSDSGFDDARFVAVWERIYDHCLTALDEEAPTGSRVQGAAAAKRRR